MMAAFTWIITFISLAGTVLNVRKNILEVTEKFCADSN